MSLHIPSDVRVIRNGTHEDIDIHDTERVAAHLLRTRAAAYLAERRGDNDLPLAERALLAAKAQALTDLADEIDASNSWETRWCETAPRLALGGNR